MISETTAIDYFSNHLLGDVFLESLPVQRNAALSMAEQDITGLLAFRPDPGDSCFIAAVCEQAVFLLCHKDELAENRVLLSETVEGLGSRSYSFCGDEKGKTAVLAPRARIYLDHLSAGRSLTLSRG